MDRFEQEPSLHSHAPNPNRLHVIRLQNSVKERAVVSEEATSVILHNVLRTAPLNIAVDLPSTEAFSQFIRRQRTPSLLDMNSQIPAILRQTDRGEDFIFFENESLIIFTTQSKMNVLNDYKHWLCDGTFSVSKSVRL